MRMLTVAATQMACGHDPEDNLNKAEDMVRRAASAGAHMVLLQELFETPYFCKDQDPAWFRKAATLGDSSAVQRMRGVARELGVVLPISWFERANTAHFNALCVIDRDGTIVGTYRKAHIPDGPGYQEKFYFNPGDTPFLVVGTGYGRIGAAICWDQWFPEVARIMALRGAEVLFYPTAIGSEPQDAQLDSRDHWTRVMQGHAAANMIPVVASNRIGAESGDSCTITFYGSSFIAGPTGDLIARAGRSEEAVLTASFDLDDIAERRRAWGLFRDRRPDLYGPLLTLDGGDGRRLR